MANALRRAMYLAAVALVGSSMPIGLGNTVRAEDAPSAWYLANRPPVTSADTAITSPVYSGMPYLSVGPPENKWIYLSGPAGSQIAPGAYHDVSYPQVEGQPLLGGNLGCGTTIADFTVSEVSFAQDGSFATLAVDFDLQCTGDFQGEWQGAVRFHSAIPVGALAADQPSYRAGNVSTAETLTVTRALTSVGTASVTISNLVLAGPGAPSWFLQNDTCSGTTVAPGSACTFDVSVHPMTAGDLPANVVVMSDAYVPTLSAVDLAAHGQVEMTVTISTSVGQPVAGQGFWLRATVFPTPENGFVDMWLDGSYLGRDPLAGASIAEHWISSVSVGVQHHASAEFYSFSADQTGDTAAYDFTAADATATSLVVSRSTTYTDIAITATATVTGPAGLTGGTLTLRDDTTSVVLKTVNVTASVRTASITTKLAAGDHFLIASYSGAPGFGASEAGTNVRVQPDLGVAVTATMPASQAFYPYRDGYRDTVAIGATLDEPATVSVSIFRSSGSRLVTINLGTKTGAYHYTWSGRNSAGAMYAADKYRVVQTLKDGTGHVRVLTSYVYLSAKRLVLYTTYITKLNADALKKTSSWAVWQFTLPSATVYKTLTFQVYGKSQLMPGLDIGGQDFRICSMSTYGPSCVATWTTAGYSTSWYSKALSPTYNRYGRYVRGLVAAGYGGSGLVYKVRLKVTYGVLK